MPNLDLDILKIFHGDTPVLKVMQGDTTVWLPYDSQVEYIESTGSEYINTGVIPTTDIRLTIDGSFPVTSGSNLIFGTIQLVNGTYRRFHLGINTNTFMGGIGTNNGNIMSANTNRYTFQISGKAGRAYVGSSYYAGNTTYPTIPIYLFARNYDGSASNMHRFRMYSAHIYSYGSDAKLMDFIPVRKGQVGYLYDKVSGQLFGNAASSGSFTLGADI